MEGGGVDGVVARRGYGTGEEREGKRRRGQES